ncbi:MAG: helicase [Dorea sp.]|nr:helicase [Dorea sp.]
MEILICCLWIRQCVVLQLGLCSKSMVVVPNHIIEQFAAEWMQLYPAANLLVATKKDFEAKNRKKFCARIATSDIDAVIIGHSQFEKIPLSVERQERMLERQIEEVMEGIAEAKSRQGERFTVKQLEKSRKSLEARLKKLNDQSRKDDVVCFEELGVDRLFVDEADSYKNLCLYTKMRNVGGISQTEAQKSSDMFMKCRYLDGLTGGRGVVFATGTPVSNSMTELYTMQRYLQYPALEGRNLQHFDAWASTFGETVTAIELAPEGSGYRLKTRFAKFYNLPELMQMFREVADIQTADMLKLPVPEAEYRVVSVKPSRIQKSMVEELGKRAEEVREGTVGICQDNMLLITNDGRKLALDQRLMNELLPDEEGSKVNACVREVFRYWEQGKEEKLTQLLFCDLSVPKSDGTFSVYNDIRDKLIAKGIPPQEIEFIHDANTEARKKELFSKVRRGAVRILMGSTFKMGAGTNVQNLIIASHDLDCPWRPRDLEQRAGRTIRQGNRNKKVDIVRYVTEGTFDAYLYQMIENKQKFISQIMTSKSPARTIEDVDEAVLSYAEIKALAAGNPHIKEKMNLDIEVSKLQLLKQSFLSQRYEMEDRVLRTYPEEIRNLEKEIAGYCKDIATVKENTPSDRDVFPPMKIGDAVYNDKKEAGNAIIAACKAMLSTESAVVGSYRGLVMELSYSTYGREFIITLKGILKHQVALGTDIYGNVTRLDNKIAQFEDNLARCGEKLENTKNQLETAKNEISKPFPKEDELAKKTERLGELNRLLDLDKKEGVLLEDEPEESESVKGREGKERER